MITSSLVKEMDIMDRVPSLISHSKLGSVESCDISMAAEHAIKNRDDATTGVIYVTAACNGYHACADMCDALAPEQCKTQRHTAASRHILKLMRYSDQWLSHVLRPNFCTPNVASKPLVV